MSSLGLSFYYHRLSDLTLGNAEMWGCILQICQCLCWACATLESPGCFPTPRTHWQWQQLRPSFQPSPPLPRFLFGCVPFLRPRSLTWCTAVGAHFRPLQLSGHLESYSDGEVDECSDEIHPLAQLSNRRLPSTDAAPESPEAGCWGCLRGQIAAKFPGG